MKIFSISKDGGPKSNVWAFWFLECKWLFSVVLLRFSDKSRDEFHSHAFNGLSWVLRGGVLEEMLCPPCYKFHWPSWRPIKTLRSTVHRVFSVNKSLSLTQKPKYTWVLNIRGPWSWTWREWHPTKHIVTTLTHGRKVVFEQHY